MSFINVDAGDFMAEFKFDINKSVQENIDLFLVLMGLVDEEMTKLLVDNMGKMTPSPEQGPQRTAARVAFNKAIMEGLENLII
jgi:hypothetical protein